VFLHQFRGDIEVGEDTHFGQNCTLYGPLLIGSKCAIAANVVFASLGHQTQCDVSRVDLPVTVRSIVLGDNVWVGANAVILGGVTIGDGAIVGAGAVVTHDVLPGQTVVGVPARPIGRE
jgi:acetyltransferase-like isoleucine patch superfamily enzyme